MYPRRRQATLQSQDRLGIRTASDSQRRTSRYADPSWSPGSFSAPVARLSKWPKNVFFASDFIAEKVATASSTSARRGGGRRRSTDARKKAESGRRTVMGGHEHTTTRHRINKKTAAYRSSDGSRAIPQSIQEKIEIEREQNRPDDGRGQEGANFLEQTASALLLLHSRFFGGVRQEEGIVCRLCMLCREAGWMGNPPKACPGIDPLVLEQMVVAWLRRWERNIASGHSKNNLSRSEEMFSFEAFYGILAEIATLTYPREGKAMKKLLLEGVLPLAADNKARIWSPRPELLYGRPALAALRMQRGALHQLYCTYKSTVKTEGGSSGISKGVFLRMLTDLGVTPVSVSEQHAASVFDDVLRNGLEGTEPPLVHKQQQQLRRKDSGTADIADEDFDSLEVGNYGRGPFPSRKPWHDRLCWSMFLEAMAALAVGAVKQGHATATTKGRNIKPESKPGHWNNKTEVKNVCGARRRVRSLGESGYPERQVSGRLDAEVDCRSEQGAGKNTTATNENPGSWEVPCSGGSTRTREDPLSDRCHQASYGGSCYHDSRKEVELLPTLREIDTPLEHPGSPVRYRQPSHPQQAPQGGEHNISIRAEPTSTRRAANQLSPNAVTAREERERTVTVRRHFGEAAFRVVQNIHEQGRAAVDCYLIEQRSKPKKRTPASSSGGKNRPPVEITLPDTPHASSASVVEHCSTEGDRCRVLAREAGRTEETTDRVSTTTATADDRCSIPQKPIAPDETPSPQFTVLRPNRGACQATTCKVFGRTPTVENEADADVPYAGVARCREISKPSVSLSGAATELGSDTVPGGQDPIGLSKRRVKLANVQPAKAHPPVSRFLKGGSGERRKEGGLWPAPYHGGSLRAVQRPSSTTPTASEGSKRPPCRPSVSAGKKRGGPPPDSDSRAADTSAFFRPSSCQSKGFVTDTASGDGAGQINSMVGAECDPEKRSALVADEMVVQEEPSRSGWSRVEELGHATEIDDAPMNFEAASATIFEELLAPRVVAVHSRHRRKLLELYRRYSRSVGPDGEEFRCISDAGVWRFVSAFPVLARWAEGDGLLQLIIRASRDRGWNRCGEEAAGQSPGLTYLGFLEVLTRMAYATCDRSPLHLELLELISALN